jgi:internalin A
MHSMHRCFLTNNTIYVIVLSGRAEDMERRLRYWMTSLNSFTAGNCPVIVLENRFDVRNIQSVNTTQIRRQYKNISAVLSLNVKEASNIEFAELLEIILSLAASKSLYGQRMPKLWADVKQALEISEEPYLTERQFMALFRNSISDVELHNILDWFNELGVSFSCHKDTNHCVLPDYVVLNPEWATNAIYAIITSQESNTQPSRTFDGILTLTQIIGVLRSTMFVNKRGGIQQEYSRTEIKELSKK